MILGVPSAVEQDVGRLEVAVDDALLVGGVHGPGQRLDQRGGLGRAAAACRPAAAARLPPVDELQREERQAVVLADLVDLDDVGVLQPGDRLGLGAEAGQLAGPAWPPARIIFRATTPVEADLPGLVDDAHAAAAQLAEDLVAGHGPARAEAGRPPAPWAESGTES